MNDAVTADPVEGNTLEVRLEFAFSIFLRLLSLGFLFFTLTVWSWAVGYSTDPALRFDLMSADMRIYVAVLAVLQPVTSVGLWTTLAWGRVVWLICVAFQLGFLFTNPGVFGDPRLVIVFHLCCVAVYVVFQILLHRVANKE